MNFERTREICGRTSERIHKHVSDVFYMPGSFVSLDLVLVAATPSPNPEFGF